MAKLVLGESIADLGGVTIAYRALLKSMEAKARGQHRTGSARNNASLSDGE
jgi:predicted metalloendopeptidase